MFPVRSLSLALCGLLAAGAAQSAPTAPVSYFPEHDLGRFLAQHFDLASIRSSLGPRRTPQLHTFADLGMMPTTATDDLLEFDTPDWFFQLRITGRRDVNKDGIEDLEACFVDQGRNGASYNTQQSLLISRYAAQGPAVALNYSVDACAQAARQASQAAPAASEDAGPAAAPYQRIGKFIYAFYRIVSADELKRIAYSDDTPTALATRAGKLAQRFDDILAAQARVSDADIDATLREAVDVAAALADWRRAGEQ
nr:hypothetical protein [uncultured Massilia sp.]